MCCTYELNSPQIISILYSVILEFKWKIFWGNRPNHLHLAAIKFCNGEANACHYARNDMVTNFFYWSQIQIEIVIPRKWVSPSLTFLNVIAYRHGRHHASCPRGLITRKRFRNWTIGSAMMRCAVSISADSGGRMAVGPAPYHTIIDPTAVSQGLGQWRGYPFPANLGNKTLIEPCIPTQLYHVVFTTFDGLARSPLRW